MEKDRRCPRCAGTGTITGIFPVYADHIPLEEREPVIKIPCDICENGIVDEKFSLREAEGKRLRAIRLECCLSLRDFAKRFELDVGTISGLERGKIVLAEDAVRVLAAYETIKNIG